MILNKLYILGWILFFFSSLSLKDEELQTNTSLDTWRQSSSEDSDVSCGWLFSSLSNLKRLCNLLDIFGEVRRISGWVFEKPWKKI